MCRHIRMSCIALSIGTFVLGGPVGLQGSEPAEEFQLPVVFDKHAVVEHLANTYWGKSHRPQGWQTQGVTALQRATLLAQDLKLTRPDPNTDDPQFEGLVQSLYDDVFGSGGAFAYCDAVWEHRERFAGDMAKRRENLTAFTVVFPDQVHSFLASHEAYSSLKQQFQPVQNTTLAKCRAYADFSEHHGTYPEGLAARLKVGKMLLQALIENDEAVLKFFGDVTQADLRWPKSGMQQSMSNQQIARLLIWAHRADQFVLEFSDLGALSDCALGIATQAEASAIDLLGQLATDLDVQEMNVFAKQFYFEMTDLQLDLFGEATGAQSSEVLQHMLRHRIKRRYRLTTKFPPFNDASLATAERTQFVNQRQSHLNNTVLLTALEKLREDLAAYHAERMKSWRDGLNGLLTALTGLQSEIRDGFKAVKTELEDISKEIDTLRQTVDNGLKNVSAQLSDINGAVMGVQASVDALRQEQVDNMNKIVGELETTNTRLIQLDETLQQTNESIDDLRKSMKGSRGSSGVFGVGIPKVSLGRINVPSVADVSAIRQKAHKLADRHVDGLKGLHEKGIAAVTSGIAPRNPGASPLDISVQIYSIETPVIMTWSFSTNSYYVQMDVQAGQYFSIDSEHEQDEESAPDHNAPENALYTSSFGSIAVDDEQYQQARDKIIADAFANGMDPDPQVLFASERFTHWCSIENFANYAFDIYITEGETADEVKAKIRQMLKLEYHDIVSWLRTVLAKTTTDFAETKIVEATELCLRQIVELVSHYETVARETALELKDTYGSQPNIDRLEFQQLVHSRAPRSTVSLNGPDASLEIDGFGKLTTGPRSIDYQYRAELDASINTWIGALIKVEEFVFGGNSIEKLRDRFDRSLRGYEDKYLGSPHGAYVIIWQPKFERRTVAEGLAEAKKLLTQKTTQQRLADREKFREEFEEVLKKICQTSDSESTQSLCSLLGHDGSPQGGTGGQIPTWEERVLKAAEDVANSLDHQCLLRDVDIIDLRCTPLKSSIEDFVYQWLTVGEESEVELERLEYDLDSNTLHGRLSLTHRESVTLREVIDAVAEIRNEDAPNVSDVLEMRASHHRHLGALIGQ